MDINKNIASMQEKLLENSPFAIMMFVSARDDEGTIVDFEWLFTNKAAEKVVKFTHASLLHKRLTEVMPGVKEDGLFDIYKKVVETGESVSFEHCYNHEGFDSCFSIYAAKNEDGFIVEFHNITNYKKENNSLQMLMTSQENLYRLIFNTVRDCIAIYKAVDGGKDFEFVDFNRSGEVAESITKDKLIGKKVTEVFPGVIEFGLLEIFTDVFQSGKSVHYPLGFYDDERISGWRENYVYKLDDEHIVAVYLDITKEKQAEADLRLSAKVFESSLEGILITDKKVKIIKVNSAFCKMSGYTFEEIAGKKANILKSDVHPESFYQEMWKELNENGSWEGEIWDRKKDGKAFAVYLTIAAVYDHEGEVKNYIGVYLDITEKLKTQERIQRLAFYDTLTHLANRSHFNDELDQRIKRSKRHHHSFALLFIDLDDFKKVNDRYGHHVGDKLLIGVAEIIKQNIREIDFAARLSGDEFLVLCSVDSNAKTEVVNLARRIIEAFKEPIDCEEYQLSTSCSIGISVYPDDGVDAETLIKSADVAMYQSKNSGKNQFAFHSIEMFESYSRRLILDSCLQDAIRNDEFEMYYQPKVCPYSGKVTGAEALIRWFSPELGYVSPLEFISYAEENGLIDAIGQIVFDRVLAFVAQLQQAGLLLTISINLSSVQLNDVDLIQTFSKKLDQFNCHPSMLEFEITESKIMENVESNIQTLEKIKSLGVGISIDDFGTGYSSLSYLQKMPVDVLKIDKSFVDEAAQEGNDAVLIKGVISLAKALSLTTVAEGVESIEQVEFLKENHCDIIQGYYYSKPLPKSEFIEYIKTHS